MSVPDEAADAGADALPSELRGAAVFDFVQDFLDDRERGGVKALRVYLARYPGHEEAIAAQYLELVGEAPELEDESSDDRRKVGAYRLLRPLGAGGQGAVWLAEDSRIRRRVAVKLLHGGFVSEERRARFRREAETIARLEHPGLCGILEANVEGDLPFLAMPLVDGEPLSSALEAEHKRRARSPRPPRTSADLPWCPEGRAELTRVLLFFERAARALHAAHEAGVVHRDVKPGNLVVTPSGDPVVLDFGLARDERSEVGLTRTGEVFGTPAYMSPEQLRGLEADRRSDVYALGASLYEALTLARPFDREERLALERAILLEPTPDPRRANPTLTEDVRVVLETALDKEPARRYANALELAEDLRRIREYEPIRARPAGAGLRLARWMRREPALATALVGTLLFLSAGLAMALTLLASERAARRFADGRWFAERTTKLVREDAVAALALGIEAVRLAPSYLTRSALYGPLEACQLERALSVEESPRLWDLSLSCDGRLALAAADAGGARIWRIEDGGEIEAAALRVPGVRHAAFLPGGKRAVIADQGGEVRVVDLERDVPVWTSTVSEGAIVDLELAPTGELLAVQPEDGPVRVLRAADGRLLAELDAGLGATRLCLSPSGTHLVSVPSGARRAPSSALCADLWELARGARVAALEHPAPVLAAAFSPGGDTVATGDEGGHVRLWNARDGSPARSLRLSAPVLSLAFDAAGRRLAIGLGGGAGASLVELASGVGVPLEGHQGDVVHVAFDPAGERVATTSYDRSVRVWRVRDGANLRVLRARFQPERTLWTPDGRRLVTLSNSPRLHVWRAAWMPYAFRLVGHQGPVVWGEFLPGGERAVTASADGTVRVWHTPAAGPRATDPDPGTELAQLAHGAPIVSAALGGGGRTLLSVAEDGSVRLFDLETGTLRADFPEVGDGARQAFLAPDARSLVVVDVGGGAWLQAVSGVPGTVELAAPGAGVRAVAYAPDGRTVALAGRESCVRLFDARTGRPAGVCRFEVANTLDSARVEGIEALAFAPSGRELAVAGSDHMLRWIDIDSQGQTREPLLSFTHRSLAYSSDGTRLLVTGDVGGGSIRVVDLANRLWSTPAVYHAARITSSALDATARRVVTSSIDHTAFVWGVSGGAPLAHFSEHSDEVTWAAFAPPPPADAEGAAAVQRVLTASADGTAAVWPVDPLPAALARRPRELYEWEWERELRLAAPTEEADDP